jgi:hypothetical protein
VSEFNSAHDNRRPPQVNCRPNPFFSPLPTDIEQSLGIRQENFPRIQIAEAPQKMLRLVKTHHAPVRNEQPAKLRSINDAAFPFARRWC